MRGPDREFRAGDRLRDVRLRIELHSLDFAGDAFEVKEHRGQLVGEVSGGFVCGHMVGSLSCCGENRLPANARQVVHCELLMKETTGNCLVFSRAITRTKKPGG